MERERERERDRQTDRQTGRDGQVEIKGSMLSSFYPGRTQNSKKFSNPSLNLKNGSIRI